MASGLSAFEPSRASVAAAGGGVEFRADDPGLGQAKQELSPTVGGQCRHRARQELVIGRIVGETEPRDGAREIAQEIRRVERSGEAGHILPGQHRHAADVLGLREEGDLAPQRRLLNQSARRKQARPIEKLDRRLGVPLRLEDRAGEGDLARKPRVERGQIRLPEQSDGVGLVIGDVGERAARERPLRTR